VASPLQTTGRMRRFWHDYSLSLVLAALFFASWISQTVFGWLEWAAEQRALGETPQLFGSDGYVWSWGRATFENWQSEFLQLLTFVGLSAILHHKGSPEAKDSDEQTEAHLSRIEARLVEIERRLTPSR
jgi:hypothetical protein